jgi:hypothetical protein
MLICTAISKYPKQADHLKTLLAYTKNTVSHIPSKLSPQTYILKHQFHSVSQVITRFQLLLSQKKYIQSREIRWWKKLPRAKEICELKFEENKTKKHNKTKQSFKPTMFICTTIELTFTSRKSESSLKQFQGSETSRSYTGLSLPTQNTGSHNPSKWSPLSKRAKEKKKSR